MRMHRYDEWIDVGTGRLRPLLTVPTGKVTNDEASRRDALPKRKLADAIHPHPTDPPLAAQPPPPSLMAVPIPLAVTTAAAVRGAALGLRQRHVRKTYGVEVCGRRVRIRCGVAEEGDDAWYWGWVASYREHLCSRHFIRFDDGDQSWLSLESEEEAGRLAWAPLETGTAGTSSSPPATANDVPCKGLATSAAASQAKDLPPTLCDWHWMADGKLSGHVYGKAGFKDGTLITTSVVPRSQRTHTYVVTETGTAYLLGSRGAQQPSPVCGIVAQMRHSRTASGGALCSICQETCEPKQSWDVTPCGHAFHQECLRRWVAYRAKEAADAHKVVPQPTCPDCRHPLSSSRFRLFGCHGTTHAYTTAADTTAAGSIAASTATDTALVTATATGAGAAPDAPPSLPTALLDQPTSMPTPTQLVAVASAVDPSELTGGDGVSSSASSLGKNSSSNWGDRDCTALVLQLRAMLEQPNDEAHRLCVLRRLSGMRMTCSVEQATGITAFLAEQLVSTSTVVLTAAPGAASHDEETCNWAQCDRCGKWRRLPDACKWRRLPEQWFCNMNPDRKANFCDAPEHQMEADEVWDVCPEIGAPYERAQLPKAGAMVSCKLCRLGPAKCRRRGNAGHLAAQIENELEMTSAEASGSVLGRRACEDDEPEAEDARESAIADATQSLMVEILNLWEAQLAQEPLAPCLACRGQHRKHTCRL